MSQMPKKPNRIFFTGDTAYIFEKDYDALRQYAEGLEKDAERYRFLRDSQARATDSDWPAIRQDDACSLEGKSADQIIDRFIERDAAIDAAMKGDERE